MTSDPANRGSSLGVTHEDELVLAAPFYRGTNNRSLARNIGEEWAAELLNVDLTDPTLPRRRDGYREIQSKLTGSLRGSLFAELQTGPTSRLLVAGFPGGATYATHAPNGPAWVETRVTEDTMGAANRTLDVAGDQAKAAQGNDLLWLVSPSTGIHVHAMDYLGNWTDLGDANESPPVNAVDCAYMLSRMWFLAGDRLYWSKLLPTLEDMVPTPAAFDRANIASTGGGSLNMSPDRGAYPVAIVPWREESLIVFYRNHIEEVIVDPVDPIDSTRRRLEGRIGCIARDSIVQIGNEIYFLDQFGSYRSLRRNQQGAAEGVVPEPLSEPFRGELPQNLNFQYAYKAQAALLEEFLYLFYPAGSSTDPNRAMVVDLGGQRIYGPWEFAHPFSRILVSDIEGGAYRMYGLNGSSTSPSSKVYRFFDGTYADDGTAITYRETGRAWDFGFPHVNKIPKWYDMEFTGGYVACTPLLSVRVGENQDWVSVRTKTLEYDGTNSFPILSTDFPLTSGSFPLIQAEPTITTMKGTVDEYHEGDLPLYSSDLPITEADLPIDGGGGVLLGRVVQYRVEESTVGAPFERVGLRLGVQLQNLDLEDET